MCPRGCRNAHMDDILRLCPRPPALARAPEKRYVSVSIHVLTQRPGPPFHPGAPPRALPTRLMHTHHLALPPPLAARVPTTPGAPCSFDPLLRARIIHWLIGLGVEALDEWEGAESAQLSAEYIARWESLGPTLARIVAGRWVRGVTRYQSIRARAPPSSLCADGGVDLRADDDTLPFLIASHRFPALVSSVCPARSRVLPRLPTGTPAPSQPHILKISTHTLLRRRSTDPRAAYSEDRDAASSLQAGSGWIWEVAEGAAGGASLPVTVCARAASLGTLARLHPREPTLVHPRTYARACATYSGALPRRYSGAPSPSGRCSLCIRARVVYLRLSDPAISSFPRLESGTGTGRGCESEGGAGDGNGDGEGAGDEPVGGWELRCVDDGKGREDEGRRGTGGLSDGLVWRGSVCGCAGAVHMRARTRV
ncbi:hypothetical protein C8F04DRAFT_272648 [Mycena alexandri]|uniref:Uncharacterized protein n=1 Tax=Mycena alexandri TaxID=1745969 RepID=A0AAD6T9U2_9AGAR|nr:hypothetical protein C8F04DRAFT_272648 [Mycena alexandri]